MGERQVVPIHSARLAVGCLAIALGLALLAAPPVAGQVKIPPDFEMEKAESSPGQVTFSHAKHLVKVGKCTTCHMKDLKLHRGQSGPITLEAKQQGKYCGACHDGKRTLGGAVVFPIDECDKCHLP